MLITEQAESDLAGIWAFIAEDSPDAAARFIHEIQDRFEPLRHNPEIGPRRDAIAPGLRAQFHKGYVLYYRHTEDGQAIGARPVRRGQRRYGTKSVPSAKS